MSWPEVKLPELKLTERGCKVAQLIKDEIVRLAFKLGYLILPRWKVDNYPLAMHLKSIFKMHGVDCVIDVGANKGQYGRFLRDEVGYEGIIVSLEPIIDNYKVLSLEVSKDSTWFAYNLALGERKGEAKINVTERSELSSILDPSIDETDFCAKSKTIVKKESINIDMLSAIYREFEANHVITCSYLKIDTQGYDLKVLEGAGSVLSEFCALQTELSFIPLYHGMSDYRQVIDYLTEHNFSLSGIFSVAADENIKLLEADGVFIRNS